MSWIEGYGIKPDDIARNLRRLPAVIEDFNNSKTIKCEHCISHSTSESSYIFLDVSTLDIDIAVPNCFKAVGTCQQCGRKQKSVFLGDWALR